MLQHGFTLKTVHNAKSKKPITKDHILYGFIYIKYQNKQIYRNKKKMIRGCLLFTEREDLRDDSMM